MWQRCRGMEVAGRARSSGSSSENRSITNGCKGSFLSMNKKEGCVRCRMEAESGGESRASGFVKITRGVAWVLSACGALPKQEEVEEVEQKVAEAEHSRSAARRFLTRFCTPVFLEAFALTFLAGAPQLQPSSPAGKSRFKRSDAPVLYSGVLLQAHPLLARAHNPATAGLLAGWSPSDSAPLQSSPLMHVQDAWQACAGCLASMC